MLILRLLTFSVLVAQLVFENRDFKDGRYLGRTSVSGGYNIALTKTKKE